MRKLEKRVYLVLNISTGNYFAPQYLVKRDITQFPHVLSVREVSVTLQALDTEYGRIRQDLATVGRIAGAIVIDPIDTLCSEDCKTADQFGDPIYKDLSHLRASFVRDHASFIDITVTGSR